MKREKGKKAEEKLVKSKSEKTGPERKTGKTKADGYVMKKNASLKILRVVLWAMIGFIFFKGVLSCFQRDRADEVDAMIRNFKANYSQFTGENEEVMAFAQNFAREYLTYTARGEEDYKNRLKDYVATNFFNESTQDFTASAEAVYVQAYRMEDYTGSQKDVYVQAEVEYTRRLLQDGISYTEEVTRQPVTLKVPIYCNKGTYVVESLPLMVSDSVLEKYAAEEYYGSSLTDTESEKIKGAVDNFLKAYCEQDESVIDYYLDASADRTVFAGLNGRFTYQGITDMKCYRDTTGDIVCLVKFKVQDIGNDVKLLQKINLVIEQSGDRYYVKEMNARIGNLKVN